MEEILLDQNVDLNITNQNISESNVSRDELLARFEIATLILIFIITTIGNSSVLIALCYRRSKITRMYFYILHLSIADLVTAFFNVIPQLAWEFTYRFKGGDELCRIIKFLQLLGPYLSSFILVLTAVDRFHAICSPLSYCTWPAKRAKALVMGAWVLALLCCLPQVVIFSYQPITPGGDVFDCWATFPPHWGERAYVSWYTVSVFLAPLVILLFTYTCICRAIWKNYNSKKLSTDGLITNNKNSNMQPRVHSIRGISRAKIKTVKLTIVVIACYIICSTPFISAQLWATWDPMAMHSPFWSGATFTIVTLLASLNSCVNPWIYLIFNPELVVLLKNAILCRAQPRRPRYTGPGTGGGSNSSDSRCGSSHRRSRNGPNHPLISSSSMINNNKNSSIVSSGAKLLNYRLLNGNINKNQSNLAESTLITKNNTIIVLNDKS